MALSPVQTQKFLSDMDYPASKGEIINHAREKGADEEVMATLEALPEKEYASAAEVSKALSEKK
ncbi:MAG: DUF2795 domain-containing protein [bacterium]